MTSLAVLNIPHLSIGEGTSHLASRLDASGPHSFPTVTQFLVSLKRLAPLERLRSWVPLVWRRQDRGVTSLMVIDM